MQDIEKNTQEYNQHANAWAERLRSGSNAAHRWLEKPAMASFVPENSGIVLALGCGSGEETDLLKAKGAKKIIGIDISDELILKARHQYPTEEWLVQSMENLSNFEDESIDFVYSSLAFHYLPSWTKILSETSRVLKKNGMLLFSTHHPLKWGALSLRDENKDEIRMGYIRPKNSDIPTVSGNYFESREIKDTWFGNMEVSFYHRPLDEIFSEILQSNFHLEIFSEPRVTENAKIENPKFYEIHSKIPLFMIFGLRKK